MLVLSTILSNLLVPDLKTPPTPPNTHTQKSERKKNGQKIFFFFIHNGKYQCHMVARCNTTYQPSSSCKKAQHSEKYVREFFGEKKIRRMDQKMKNDKRERARGLGRKAKEEIGNGNQTTALRFLTGV